MDWTDSTLKFAEEHAARFIVRATKELPFDPERGLPLDPEEIGQVARIAAIGILRRPKRLNTVRKFSRVMSEAVDTAIEAALEEAVTSRFSFSPGEKKEGAFKNFAELTKVQRAVEAFEAVHGHFPRHAELQAHVGAPMRSFTTEQLESVKAITPLGTLPHYLSPTAITEDGHRRRVIGYVLVAAEPKQTELDPLEHAALLRRIHKIRNSLDSRERVVFDERLMRDPNNRTTIGDLASRFRCSKQTILNIESDVIAVLPAETSGLADYYFSR